MATKLTKELQETVLLEIGKGTTLSALARDLKLPNLRAWVFQARLKSEDFRHQYWEAQRQQLEAYNERIMELSLKPYDKTGEMSFPDQWQTRRLEIDTLKWVCARMSSSQGCKNFKGSFKSKTKSVGEALTTGMIDVKTAESYLSVVEKEVDITEKTEITDTIRRHLLTKDKDKVS